MKLCPKCNTEHEKSGKFCSRTCANSRTWNEEDKLLKSKRAKEIYAANPKKFLTKTEAQIKGAEKWKAKYAENLENGVIVLKPFDVVGFDRKRIRILKEQNNCCIKCGLDKWLGEKLPLEIDHINGDNKDNRRENLEAVCPNCHSLTPTWRGRNMKKVFATDEELLSAIDSSLNIRQALISLGVAAKGSNYRRANKLINERDKLINPIDTN